MAHWVIDDMLLMNEGEVYADKFAALSSVRESGDKIGTCDGSTYVSWGWLQGLQRIYYRESRRNTMEYLTKEIPAYTAFFKRILQLCGDSSLTHERRRRADALLRRHRDLVNSWLSGLQVLKCSYSSDEHTCRAIDSLIMTLTEICVSRPQCW